MSVLLFVYGTLKTNFSRNHYLAKQIYIGTAKTTPEYSMYTLGGFPCLLNKKLAEKNNVPAQVSVYGELWQVDEECLVVLDKVEGVDSDLFERLPVHLEEINLCRLPTNQDVWKAIESKNASAYLFKQTVSGAANCGSFWSRK